MAAIVSEQPEAGAANGVTLTRDELELLSAEWTSSNIADLDVEWKIGVPARSLLHGVPVIELIRVVGIAWLAGPAGHIL